MSNKISKAKEAKIIHLLESGASRKTICSTAKVANTVVMRISRETGLREVSAGKYMNKKGAVTVVEKFVCPGIKYCGHCRHVFEESVCPL